MARRKTKEIKSQFLERLVVMLLITAVGAVVYFNFLADRIESSSTKQAGFDVLRGCRLIDHRSNDGDSFHISHARKEYVFRLYYVDCAEKSSNRFKKRLADQGNYFGGMSEQEVVELGYEAKDYTEYLLKKGEIVIYTNWEPVYDSGRFYAFVTVDGRLLSELLVEKGLARIYTRGVKMPDGESFKSQRDDLRKLEAKAKAAKLGGWK